MPSLVRFVSADSLLRIAVGTAVVCSLAGAAAPLLAQPDAPERWGESPWLPADEAGLDDGSRWIVPERYRVVGADLVRLEAALERAPLERTAGRSAAAVLWLPMPDGGEARFWVEESPVMAPGLAERYPQIRTYRVWGADDATATGRLDLTPQGFHGMIRGADGVVFIDPYRRGDRTHYVVYFAHDHRRPAGLHLPPCLVTADQSARDLARVDRGRGVDGGGTVDLLTYRLAVAATGEYTTFHGGTVPAGQAAIVTAVNRVNEVYENDLSIFMELIAGNDALVYTDGGTDPYTNSSGFTMLGQNQANIDTVIGSAGYDIGHVFSTGGGGVASLGVVCSAGSKARGVTGLGSPTGDPFYIDYVAHEMGHQYAGTHTFNGSSGACSGANRTAATAYEPGSGTTIMAYAGICSGQNIQSNSDPYFHFASLDQISSFTRSGGGSTCGSSSATGNEAPAVEAGASFDIPLNTPFRLCGSATDPDGDALTFAWEQSDLGPAGAPNAPVGNAPIFRSFESVSSGERWFPSRSDVLGGVSTLGEILPGAGRSLSFRLTARDNAPGGGFFGFDTTTLNAVAGTGPFEVLSPNGGEVWAAGSQQTVTWNSAGTFGGTVGCGTIYVVLSLDGGMTFPAVIASEVTNTGSVQVDVPDYPSSEVRLKIGCHDNVFFDVADADLTITGSGSLIFADGFDRCEMLDPWSAVQGLAGP